MLVVPEVPAVLTAPGTIQRQRRKIEPVQGKVLDRVRGKCAAQRRVIRIEDRRIRIGHSHCLRSGSNGELHIESRRLHCFQLERRHGLGGESVRLYGQLVASDRQKADPVNAGAI